MRWSRMGVSRHPVYAIWSSTLHVIEDSERFWCFIRCKLFGRQKNHVSATRCNVSGIILQHFSRGNRIRCQNALVRKGVWISRCDTVSFLKYFFLWHGHLQQQGKYSHRQRQHSGIATPCWLSLVAGLFSLPASDSQAETIVEVDAPHALAIRSTLSIPKQIPYSLLLLGDLGFLQIDVFGRKKFEAFGVFKAQQRNT